MMAFSIGQKVVTIRAWSLSRKQGFNAPHKWQIYTIRAFCPNAECKAILLEEIINTRIVRFAVTNRYGEPSFALEYFRPLQTTSIEALLSQKAPKDSALWDNRKRKLPAKERA